MLNIMISIITGIVIEEIGIVLLFNIFLFDSSLMARFLRDESYWGDKGEGYLGVIGRYAWCEEFAYNLASEYEQLTGILTYYRGKYEENGSI